MDADSRAGSAVAAVDDEDSDDGCGRDVLLLMVGSVDAASLSAQQECHKGQLRIMPAASSFSFAADAEISVLACDKTPARGCISTFPGSPRSSSCAASYCCAGSVVRGQSGFVRRSPRNECYSIDFSLGGGVAQSSAKGEGGSLSVPARFSQCIAHV